MDNFLLVFFVFSYAIKIICPEESFTIVASTPQEKVHLSCVYLGARFCRLDAVKHFVTDMASLWFCHYYYFIIIE